jgi:ketosteroid isomerase-like protein
MCRGRPIPPARAELKQAHADLLHKLEGAIMTAIQASDGSRSAIDAVNREFVEAFIRKDSAAIASLYTMNGQLLPPRTDIVSGRAAIARYWQEAMKIGIRKLETTELEIYDKMAHEVGRYAIEALDSSKAGAGMYIVIWKLEAGAWKMHRDIWNTR